MPPTTSADCMPMRLIVFCTAPTPRRASGSFVRSCRREVRVCAISALLRRPTKLASRASSGACHSYSPHLTFRGGGQSPSWGSRPCQSWNSATKFFRPAPFEQAPVARSWLISSIDRLRMNARSCALASWPCSTTKRRQAASSGCSRGCWVMCVPPARPGGRSGRRGPAAATAPPRC